MRGFFKFFKSTGKHMLAISNAISVLLVVVYVIFYNSLSGLITSTVFATIYLCTATTIIGMFVTVYIMSVHVKLKRFVDTGEIYTTHNECYAKSACEILKDFMENNVVNKSKIILNDEYYTLLKETRRRANKHILLTNFTKNPEANETGNNYFIDDVDLIKTANIPVYRIVTIHNEEKLSLCKKMVEMAQSNNLRNFYLAYLNVENFGPIPPLIGVDIVDDEVFILNPRKARVSNTEPDGEHVYIKSKEIADTFKKYHHKIWNEISDHNLGYHLYSGNNGVSRNIDFYWDEIAKSFN